MELWELNACVKAYNAKKRDENEARFVESWQTAALTGAAFAGKLRRLSYYIKDTRKTTAPQIGMDEFEARLRLAEERRMADGKRG